MSFTVETEQVWTSENQKCFVKTENTELHRETPCLNRWSLDCKLKRVFVLYWLPTPSVHAIGHGGLAFNMFKQIIAVKVNIVDIGVLLEVRKISECRQHVSAWKLH